MPSQQAAAGVAVLHVAGMGLDERRPPVGIDEPMAFAALDLLAASYAGRRSVGFTLWLSRMAAVGSRAPDALAVGHDQAGLILSKSELSRTLANSP